MLEGYEVRRIENTAGVAEWIAERHYSGTAPRANKFFFELIDPEGKRRGVILYGLPSRLQAREKYQGYLELTRLWIDDECPKNSESFLIGRSLRWLKKNTDLTGVISYADPNVGHLGTVYLASNFKLDGTTGKSYHYLNKQGQRVHIRQVWERARKAKEEVPSWTEAAQAEIEGLTRVEDEGKNRYIYLFKEQATRLSRVSESERYLSFFSSETPESLWVLGLLIGDGNVHQSDGTNRVSIVGNEDTISKVQALIPGKLSKLKGKNQKVREWYVYSKPLVEFFAARGLIGKKKYIENLWPEIKNLDLKWHFIRGLVDSDGSFAWQTRNGHTFLNLGFSSANRRFAERFKAEVAPDAPVVVRETISDGNTPGFLHYAFRLSEKTSIEILDRVYDCPQGIRNEERYAKYLMGKKLYQDWTGKRCSICGDPGYSRDLCQAHEMQRRRSKAREGRSCSILGCEKPYHGKGFCMEHLWQQRKAANPLHNPEVGKRIKALREARGISQIKLSQLALGHKGNGHLSNVEKGVGFLSEKNLTLLAEFFGVSRDDLIRAESKE